ncbi:MAG: hypothetical protein LQ351_002817 [Letrouitia transgressa]|nr:MAG: hypothetical protein LQ351_002817 [Letrouitia transgressa]
MEKLLVATSEKCVWPQEIISTRSVSGTDYHADIYPEPPSLRGGGGSAIRGVTRAVDKGFTSAIVSINYFAKANLYANSRLPPYLPPFKLYLPTYPLMCLAAQYSQRAYLKASGKELDSYVAADWKLGTKAMVIKSVPIDDMNVVVFAIRGSQTFMDWAVNLKSAPSSPEGFLDDPGNLCHSGFLSVARKMIQPVAARLRFLLEENPSRSGFSLLITGHSAGGAIASLLYAHMLAEVSSELNILTGCFKRVHCLTFGTPPISLLPLSKPTSDRYKKSLFLSFINEGDPVPRADRAYIRSLLDLYTSPAPPSYFPKPPAASCKLTKPLIPFSRPKPPRSNSEPATSTPLPHSPQYQKWIWKVPPCTLSNAGCLVALRVAANDGTEKQGLAAVTAEDDVRAEMTSDQELRSVVFGNPVMHMMKVYARRAEILATKAVTARIWE